MSELTERAPRRPDRREFLAMGFGAFVVAMVPLRSRWRPVLVRRSLPSMGTVAELAVVHHDVRRAEHALDDAVAALARVERLMTRFTPTSDVGRVNVLGAREGVPVDTETADVLRHALAWAEASDGAFDPAIGRVSELWDVMHRHDPPPATALRRLAGRRLHRQVDLGRYDGTPAVRLASADVHLDLGGIAKGHGVDRAVAALRANGIAHGVVNVGGDLYALGHRPDGEPWTVGIRSPSSPSRIVGTLALQDAAVATSGDYEQFFRYRGMVFHHLMDPATAAPRRTAEHSVTVRASRCIDADAGATAAFGQESAAAARLLARGAGDATLVPVTE